MTMITKHVLMLVLTLCTFTTYAQVKPKAPSGTTVKEIATTTNNDIWNNRVSRSVYMYDSSWAVTQDKRKLRSERDEQSLAEQLIELVKSHKIKAYFSYDKEMTRPMSDKELQDILSIRPDTVELEDPVTGAHVEKVIMHNFNYDEIKYFRVMEDWTYTPQSGTTNIQIIAIAPQMNIYDQNGNFRIRTSMFWLKYSDVKATVEAYRLSHPSMNLASAIWNNYFTEIEK